MLLRVCEASWKGISGSRRIAETDQHHQRRTEDGPMIGVAQAKELGNIRVRLRGGRFSEPKYSVPKRAHRALLEVSEKVKKVRGCEWHCVADSTGSRGVLR
jgi:hypothetical protein